ncbi:hypothetical protein DDJ49_30400, partial [Klebsiella pneumoniae]
ARHRSAARACPRYGRERRQALARKRARARRRERAQRRALGCTFEQQRARAREQRRALEIVFARERARIRAQLWVRFLIPVGAERLRRVGA